MTRLNKLYCLILTCLLYIFFGSYSVVQAQSSCDKCGTLQVIFYDCEVLVARPDSNLAQQIPRWWQLFRTVSAARSYIMDFDPNNNCLMFLDGNYLTGPNGQLRDTVRIGPEWANLPPAGSIYSGDYLVTGSASGTTGNYLLTLQVEATVTREVVLQAGKNFTDMWDAPDVAKQIASQSFVSLFTKIRDFEKKKRAANANIAINAKEIEIIPEKKKINVGETVKVQFKLIDCDDVPLNNCTIILKNDSALGLTGPTGGKYKLDSVVTDANGIASAEFIAGGQTGTASLTADFFYHHANGHDALSRGVEPLAIGLPPVSVWKVRFDFKNNYQKTIDGSSQSLGGSNYRNHAEYLIGSAKFVLYLQSALPANKISLDFNNQIPIPRYASGNYSEFDIENNRTFINGGLASGERRTDSYSGYPLIGSTSFTFFWDSVGSQGFTIYVPFSRRGGYRGQIWNIGPPAQWDSYGSSVSDDGGRGGLFQWKTGEPNGTASKTDTSYSASFSSSTSWTEIGGDTYPINMTETKSMNMIITPASFVTAVEEIDPMTVAKFSLSQNFPNPFNPTTHFQFAIAAFQFVSLKIYDVLGREIETLVSEKMNPGRYTVEWNASTIPSGVYFYRIVTGNFVETKKMLLMR